MDSPPTGAPRTDRQLMAVKPWQRRAVALGEVIMSLLACPERFTDVRGNWQNHYQGELGAPTSDRGEHVMEVFKAQSL